MADLKKARDEQQREFEKKWVRLEITEGETFEVECAFGAKPEFKKALEDEQQRFRMEKGIHPEKELSPVQSDECFWRAADGVVLFGWRGLTDDGADVPYSIERVLALCLQNRPTYLYRIRALLLRAVTDANAHGAEAEAAVEGNSPASPPGEGGGKPSRPATGKSSSTA